MIIKSLRMLLFNMLLIGMMLSQGIDSAQANIQSSANYGISTNTLSTSGGAGTSANYLLKAAAGQWSAIGQSSSSSYRLNSGFFQAMQMPPVPVITSPDTASFTYGTAGSFTITTAGSPLPAISMSGSLPTGLSFADNGNGSAALTGTPLDVGTYPMTFTAANGNSPNAIQPFTLTVNKGSATINISNLNQTFDGTARVAAVTTTPPGLSVTVSYNGGADAPVNAGSYTITATVTDPNYQGNASGLLAVSKADQAITFSVIPGKHLGDPDFAPQASASSGLALTYASSDPAVATIVNNMLHLTGVGSSTITASQAGNENYNSAPVVTRLLTVGATPTPPKLTLSTVSDGAVVTVSVLNISGIATDPGGIASVTVNGIPVQVGLDGSFSYPVQLLAGANTISIVVTSSAGTTTTVTRHVTLDSTAPSMTLSVSDNSSYSTPLLNLTGTVTGAGILVTYMVNNGAPQSAVMNVGSFSFTANLVAGINTIEVIASDLFGNSARIKRTITYAPLFTISLSDPLTDIHVATETYLLKGTISGNSSNVTITISVNGTTFTPDIVNGLFEQKITFNGNGIYSVIVTGTDQSSNIVTIQRNFIHAEPTLDGTQFSIIDALQALRMAVGIIAPDSAQILCMDVAPLLNGVSMGDGKLDIEDALIILYMVVGII